MENLKCLICVIFLCSYNEFIVISTDSLDCNFDNGLCNWRQDQSDDFNWTRWSGETPTFNTGPDFDHTSEEGHYVYIDTSEVGSNTKARLISTEKIPGQYCFSLWYYMFGQQVRQLIVSTKEGTDTKKEIFMLSGQKERKWILQQALIQTKETFEIIIEGTVKNHKWHRRGDIAVDDIVMFSSNECPVDCSDPVPELGHANSKDIVIGSKVKITCQTGYTVTGNPSIVCQANGTWSENPVCRPVDCGKPTLNSEIVVKSLEGTTFNMSLILGCKEGFTLIGNAFMTCQDDGHWTMQPTCVIKNCSDPSPESGIVDSTSFQYGTVVKVTCNQGYKIIGKSIILCQANSTWTENPVCDQIDCGKPTLNREIVVQRLEGTTFNMSLKLDCLEGFTLIGNAFMTCQDDGNWTMQPACVIMNCSDPSPESGIVNSTSFQYGTVVKVTCNPGYKIIGKSIILCQANSSWTEIPVCDQIESETSAIIAVYVAVPTIVVVLAVLLAVYFLRKRRAHSAKRDGGQNATAMNPAIHIPNKTYDKHALIGRNSTNQFKPKDSLRPDNSYADITDDIRADTTEGVYYNTFDSECRIQNESEHHYDHMKCISKPVPDNTYSHVHGNNIDIERKPSSDPKLMQGKNNAPLRREIEIENDDYDHLDNNNPDESMKRDHSTTLIEEQYSEYDHAKAGGIDPVPLDQDDYSHIRDGKVNHETIENEKCIRDQCEYSNVPAARTAKIKTTENERKGEYEEPISHSPQYFVLEAENENKTGDELETEEKSDGNYESFNHTYFVLEKTEHS